MQRHIRNFRAPIFARLAQTENIDLTVFYSELPETKKSIGFVSAIDFNGFKAKKISLSGRAGYRLSFIKYLLFNKPDTLIIGQVAEPEIILFTLIAFLKRIKLIWWRGGNPNFSHEQINKKRLLHKIKNNILSYFDNLAQCMIVYSESALEYYAENGFNKKIFVATNSPDTDMLIEIKQAILSDMGNTNLLRHKFVPPTGKIVLFLGRLNKERKVDLLITAFKISAHEIKEIHLVIIGEGPERENLEKLVMELNLSQNITFVGGIYDDTEIMKYMMICDLFTPCGIASLAIYFAMIASKPVIAYDHGLEAHAIENGLNGYRVPCYDEMAFMEKTLAILSDDQLAASMGRQSEKLIREKYNSVNMLKGFRDAIEFPSS